MFALTLRIMDPGTLGERIRQARTNAGLTQQQLADRAGCSRSLVSQWETGLVEEISANHLRAAARAMRVSLDWLLEGDRTTSDVFQSAVQPDFSALLSAWSNLTERQRSSLLEQVEKMAKHNRELLAELKRG